MKTYTEDDILAVRNGNESWLTSQPGVIGTGVGLSRGGQVVLRIFTSGVDQATRQSIQQRLGSVPIDWEEGDVIPY